MQNTVATTVGVFVNTNAFREDLAQYWNFQETRLVTPTSSTIPIVQAAHDVLDRIFIQGYQYKKAGVIVMGISPDSPIQQDLFDLNAEQIQKMRRLDEVIDRINRMMAQRPLSSVPSNTPRRMVKVRQKCLLMPSSTISEVRIRPPVGVTL